MNEEINDMKECTEKFPNDNGQYADVCIKCNGDQCLERQMQNC